MNTNNREQKNFCGTFVSLPLPTDFLKIIDPPNHARFSARTYPFAKRAPPPKNPATWTSAPCWFALRVDLLRARPVTPTCARERWGLCPFFLKLSRRGSTNSRALHAGSLKTQNRQTPSLRMDKSACFCALFFISFFFKIEKKKKTSKKRVIFRTCNVVMYSSILIVTLRFFSFNFLIIKALPLF